jgi:hypothetical protein
MELSFAVGITIISIMAYGFAAAVSDANNATECDWLRVID